MSKLDHLHTLHRPSRTRSRNKTHRKLTEGVPSTILEKQMAVVEGYLQEHCPKNSNRQPKNHIIGPKKTREMTKNHIIGQKRTREVTF